ncbi:hypothetical protein WJX84_000244 [Apatococcus fuscideae]|uniref:Uncharacterized protein n=1 Tax=Apatococcus fuscideae TaxID=2026836 RepID=A0AAW1TDJ0_9CHLO
MPAGTPEASGTLSPCDIQALQKCLADNNGDRKKCEAEVKAFQSACSKPAPRGQPTQAAAPFPLTQQQLSAFNERED